MKTFMLVAMLIGLLLTMWLVMRDVQEQTTIDGHGAAVVKQVEQAAEVRRTAEALDKLKEKKFDNAAHE